MTDLAMPDLQAALVDAARLQQQSHLEEIARPSRHRRRTPRFLGSRGRAAAILALLLLGGAAAAFASGLISFGAPVASVPVFASSQTGLGKVAGGSVQLLGISVADPRGGPPWGMRVLSTTRGAGCLQVGRLVDGKLAALGQDGAFGNDGRAHELPLSTNIERLNCALLDRRGRLFEGVTIKSEAASAAPGVHCRPPGTYAPSRGPAPYACPLGDERNLYFGMLGPDATSITYTVDGRTRTVATVGSDGAYLIVTTGTKHRYTGAAGARERAGLYASDEVPVYSPITAISYRGGVTCHLLTAERWIYGSGACSPAVPQPFGYVPTLVPTSAQLATPVHATLLRGSGGGWEVRIGFRSKLEIASLRGAYRLQWYDTGARHEGQGSQAIGLPQHPGYSGGLIPTSQNIGAGQALTTTIDAFPPGPGVGVRGLAPGIVRGHVSLEYADGTLMQAEEDKVDVPVASFAIRVP